MKLARIISAAALLAAIAALGGCNKKKPNVPPPQAQAPTITQPAPAPEEQPAPPPPVSPEPARPQPEATPPVASQPTTTTAVKPKAKPKRPKVAKKTPPPPAPPPAPAPPPQQPSIAVVPQGGAPAQNPPQLTASTSHNAAIHQRMTTAQLQEATDYNLKSISRALTADEQAMVEHIRSYIQQSRSASADGDLDRAYNLAMKAHLLSDELVKPR